MKRNLIFIFSIFFLLNLNLRGQFDYQFKEKYDELHDHYTNSTYSYEQDGHDSWWQFWGFTLLADLRMYETTKDKCYLFKFVKYSYDLLQKRGGLDYWPQIPGDQQFFYTATLLEPMAEFIYLVKNPDNYDLYSSYIPDGIIPSSIDEQVILGFGDYANWLVWQVIPVLNNKLSGYWNPYTDYLWQYGAAAPLNFQAPYFTILHYMHKVEPNYGYGSKSLGIAQYFKNELEVYPGNNSYTWFHNYQQAMDKKGVDLYREDVVHAVLDIRIPRILYDNDVNNGIFGEEDMTRFTNTFTYNIWDRYGGGGFYNNVFGTLNDIDNGEICSGQSILEEMNAFAPGEVLGWSMLHKYDEASPPNDIYTVLMTQASKLLDKDHSAFLPFGENFCNINSMHYLSGTTSFYGLSELVNAQWQRELIDLELRRRYLNYDQDFTIKGKLTIDPSKAGGESLFHTNFTDDEFKIESGVISKMTVGEEIVFKPGFIAKRGCELHATIDPSLSNVSLKSSIISNDKLIQKLKQIDGDENIEINDKIEIYPNPFNSFINLSFQLKDNSDIKIEIFDLLGKSVFSETILNCESIGNHVIETRGFNNGVFICRLWVNSVLYEHKKIFKID